MYINYLGANLREQYGCKVYKLALSSGCTCPNRDGTLGSRGCIFCDGSGAFAEAGDIAVQIEAAKKRVAFKAGAGAKYIAYFQSFTNTYGNPERLETLYRKALEPSEIVALSIATRPDCLPPKIMKMLTRLNRIKPLWVELGLQTIFPETAGYIRRGYELSVFDEAVKMLKAAGITVVVHQILGLPGETPEMMAETARYIGRSGADGVKFHLLHVLKNTDLGEIWQADGLKLMTMGEYIDALEMCVSAIPKAMVVHRLTGDGAKRDLLAPLWSGDKKRVLNAINREFARRNVCQGSDFC